MERLMPESKVHEDRVRRLALRHGYRVTKSRERKHVPNLDNFGEFMLVNTATNFVVLGSRFDATLKDIDAFLTS
jgi:hypothetical protein